MNFIIFLIAVGVITAHFRISGVASQDRKSTNQLRENIQGAFAKLKRTNKRITANDKHMHGHFDSVDKHTRNNHRATEELYRVVKELAEALGYTIEPEKEKEIDTAKILEEVIPTMPQFLQDMMKNSPVPPEIIKIKKDVPALVLKKKVAKRSRRK